MFTSPFGGGAKVIHLKFLANQNPKKRQILLLLDHLFKVFKYLVIILIFFK
jgi:hypothetical protein